MNRRELSVVIQNNFCTEIIWAQAPRRLALQQAAARSRALTLFSIIYENY
jgi:hypothetical protein